MTRPELTPAEAVAVDQSIGGQTEVPGFQHDITGMVAAVCIWFAAFLWLRKTAKKSVAEG